MAKNDIKTKVKSKVNSKAKHIANKKKTEDKPRIKLKTSGNMKELKVRGGKGYGL